MTKSVDAMGKTTTLEDRYKIKQMLADGHSSKQIAEAMHLSISTVKKWRARIKKGQLESSMGRPPKGPLSSFAPDVSDALTRLREAHPGWGPITLQLELNGQVPSRASIARFLHAKGFTSDYEPHAGVAQPSASKTERAHHRWQLDAEGNRQIEGVGTVALLNVKDVHSRTYTGSYPALLKNARSHPTTDHYQMALRVAFAEFGLPETIQVDHASVFCDNSNRSPFPTRMHLWLTSLGVDVCFSRVRRATDQAHVERMHQTMVAQAIEGQRFHDWEHLAHRLSERREVLNRFYPCSTLEGCAPLEAFPEARHTGRSYLPEKEAAQIDLNRAYQLIAEGSYFRRVSKDGTVSLGGQIYYLAHAKPHKQLRITFDQHTMCLIFHSDNQQLRKPIKGIDKQSLMGQQWPYGPLPSFQLSIPFDWHSHMNSMGIRLFETLGVTT